MNLGVEIKNIRKNKGYTQTEFAQKCSITQTYLSQIENNVKDPNLSVLKNIGENLDIPLPFLFFLSISDTDIHESKKEAFKTLEPHLKSLIREFFAV